jgi:ribonuclease HI
MLDKLLQTRYTTHMDVKIYTDGGCSGNPGPGAWAYVMMAGKKTTVEKAGGETLTTNNRMELAAVLNAIEALPSLGVKIGPIQVFTDSRYVQQGMLEWVEKWKLNGWKTSDRTPVKNIELWQKLDALAAGYKITWCWVKGHDGDEFNERCDTLVQEKIKKLKARTPREHIRTGK